MTRFSWPVHAEVGEVDGWIQWCHERLGPPDPNGAWDQNWYYGWLDIRDDDIAMLFKLTFGI